MLHLMQRFLFMPDADEILQAHAASAAGISDPELVPRLVRFARSEVGMAGAPRWRCGWFGDR
jgi:hypothetical protein